MCSSRWREDVRLNRSAGRSGTSAPRDPLIGIFRAIPERIDTGGQFRGRVASPDRCDRGSASRSERERQQVHAVCAKPDDRGASLVSGSSNHNLQARGAVGLAATRECKRGCGLHQSPPSCPRAGRSQAEFPFPGARNASDAAPHACRLVAIEVSEMRANGLR